MREIKFRAWDKELKEYVDINNTAIDPTNGDVVELGGYELLDVNRFAVLEQYTGIKDKNGVEIYEGDIVQYGEDKDFIFVVIFKYGCFYAHNILGEKFMTDSLLGSLVMSEKVSVIGNIHENADLLVDDIGNDTH